MNKLKHFLLNSKNINKSSFIWNMAGSMLMAFQSVIMLMIITRTLNLYEAGVFTLAYASANLFLNIGKYGMRNFQVSDVKRQFNFKEYNTSRIITTVLMLIVSLVYVVIAKSKNDYNMNKTWIIIWMCLFKIVDSIEDAYLGYYQQENRLDVAGKMLTLRMILTILVFGLGLIFLRDQLISLMIATIFTTLLLIMFVTLTYPAFRKEESVHKGKVWELLRVCFPLFLGCFLAFYIGNAPKYAIDSLLSDEMQACYGFIAMPVFVIGLLNNFIFSPMIARMSMMWKERQNKDFFRLFWIQILIIGIITIVWIAGERFAVRNSGATAVVEGVGEHGCEYMTGGRVVILGPTGKNFAAGMSGGIAYVLDMDSDLYMKLNKQMVEVESVVDKYDVMELKDMIKEHVALTNSEKGKAILDNFSEYLPKFKKVLPHDYDKMLRLIAKMEEKGEDSEQAQIEAFYAMKNGK